MRHDQGLICSIQTWNIRPVFLFIRADERKKLQTLLSKPVQRIRCCHNASGNSLKQRKRSDFLLSELCVKISQKYRIRIILPEHLVEIGVR